MDQETLTASLLQRVEDGDLTIDDLAERKEQREELTSLGYTGEPYREAINLHYNSICEALHQLQQEGRP